MENAFVELVNKFGNGSVLTLIIVIVVKFGIKPIFDIFLDVYKERKKRILQSQLEKEKSILQSQLEMENNLKSNSLEFDKYKKDIVLPILQSIANMLEQNIQIIQDYNTVLLKETQNNIEKDILKQKLLDINNRSKLLLKELRSETRKVSIYLPKEIRSILIVFQVSLDQEFINIKNLSLVSWEKITERDVLEIIGKNASIYQTYIDCFYKLIEKYIVIGYGEKDYLSILREHNLDEDGQFISQTKHEDFCSLYILSVKRRNLEAQQELLHRILDHR